MQTHVKVLGALYLAVSAALDDLAVRIPTIAAIDSGFFRAFGAQKSVSEVE